MARPELRTRLRRARRDIDPRRRQAFEQRLAERLARHPLFRNARTLAAYLPVDGEVDPAPLVQRAWSLGKAVYLPVLVPFSENRLWFTRYEPHTVLVYNRFGIPEPEKAHRQRIAATALDLVLAPLVGFDSHGNRLGMGGGFYDRSFAFLRGRRCWRKPRLVGLAFECQRVARLRGKPWDVPLHGVVTEETLYLFGDP